jgi:hypothetical protein
MQMMWRYIAIALVVLFLASVARFYHPGLGFTALLGLPAGTYTKTPALRAIPHYEYPAWASYDGQFYVQRAFDPLLRDPTVDRAMDLAPFRARRILFSWTAYVLGMGRPAWIVNVYALQNVVCWLLLAVLLTRWIPLTSGRGVALWTACLFSHGLLWSVRFSLLDGPSLLLMACVVAAAERGQLLLSALMAGVSALGRETNLLALFAQPLPHDWRTWRRTTARCALALLPLLIWYDYLRSIYRSTLLVGTDQLVWPGAGLVVIWRRQLDALVSPGLLSSDALAFCVLFSLATQALYLLMRRDYRQPWWRVGIAYAMLMLLLDQALANPVTGAITRVLLPMTVGFNVMLAREARPVPFAIWFAAGNLHLVPAFYVMPPVG